MLSNTTHELIAGTVEYIYHLDERRKQALMEFYEYCRKLEKEKAYLERLKDEHPDLAAQVLI